MLRCGLGKLKTRSSGWKETHVCVGIPLDPRKQHWVLVSQCTPDSIESIDVLLVTITRHLSDQTVGSTRKCIRTYLAHVRSTLRRAGQNFLGHFHQTIQPDEPRILIAIVDFAFAFGLCRRSDSQYHQNKQRDKCRQELHSEGCDIQWILETGL